MREALLPLLGQRLTVQAPALRLSRRVGWGGVREPTVMVGPVTLVGSGELLADHLWLPVGKRLDALGLHIGDVVQFSGRVASYRRGLRREPGEVATFTLDYGLAYPSRCVVLARAPRQVAEPTAPDAAATNGTRLLATIGTLWQERGKPPSLPAIYAHAGMKPLAAAHTLHKLAVAGRIAFTTNGYITLATPAERSAHP